MFEGDICIESVELLLGHDGGEDVQVSVTLALVTKPITGYAVGDVVL